MAQPRKKKTTTKRLKKTRTKAATSKTLTKSLIFSANRNAMERVEVPEWGGAVFVRSVRGNEWMEFRDAVMNRQGEVIENTMMARLVALTICDAGGKRLFANDDWELVNELPLSPLMRVFRVAMKFNNLDDGDVEELSGNLPKTPKPNSGST